MPKGPPVREIFSNVSKGQQKPSLLSAKKLDEPLSMVNTKKNIAPLPPMKKFGGYKPKILSDNGDRIVPVRTDSSESQGAPTSPHPVLTKPQPFIIGDKDIPMTLSTLEDNDHEDGEGSNDVTSQIEGMHIYEEPPFIHSPNKENDVNNSNNNNINNNNSNNNNHTTNSHFFSNKLDNGRERINRDPNSRFVSNDEGFTASDDEENLINKNDMNGDALHLATENPMFQAGDGADADSGVEPELDGVFIPAPDYEEDEQSMTFDEEDPDEFLDSEQREEKERERQKKLIVEQQRRHRQELEPGMKVYAGEDLSKYLSDDEDDFFPEPVYYVESVKPKPAPVTLSAKHSLFKPKQHNTTGKRKSSKAPVFNSVRNFSFADSKYGTRGKANGMKMNPSGGEGLVTGKEDDYETFLRSKHGVRDDIPEAFPQWKPKDGNVFKKLTVRLKLKKQAKANKHMEYY